MSEVGRSRRIDGVRGKVCSTSDRRRIAALQHSSESCQDPTPALNGPCCTLTLRAPNFCLRRF